MNNRPQPTPTRRPHRPLLPAASIAVLLVPSASLAAGYTRLDVTTALPSGVTQSRLYALNNTGTALGDYTAANGTTTFFTYARGVATPYPTVNGTTLSYPTVQSDGGHLINDAGNYGANAGPNTAAPDDGTLVAGYYSPSTSTFTQFPVSTTYQTAAQLATGQQPLAINAANVVVGTQFFETDPTSAYPSSNTHGFIYNPVTRTTTDIGGAVLNPTGDATNGFSSLVGISDTNLILGQATNGTGNRGNFTTAFLGTPNGSGGYTYQDLTPLIRTLLGTGATLNSVTPSDISSNGRYVIGNYSVTTGTKTAVRAFEITDDATPVDLGTLGGTNLLGTTALSVNDSGMVVGVSTSSASASGNHAFLYANGAIADLNTLAPAANVTYTGAEGIDDAGDIVGYDAAAGGNNFSAYELTVAAPEPTSLAMALVGTAALVGRRRRRPTGRP